MIKKQRMKKKTAFVAAIFDFANMQNAQDATIQAARIWSLSRPNACLPFLNLSDDEKMDFVRQVRRALSKFIVPTLPHLYELRIKADMQLTGDGVRIIEPGLFDIIEVKVLSPNYPAKMVPPITMPMPCMAITALKRILELGIVNFLHICHQCGRYFIKPRMGVKFCCDACKHRHYYKLKKITAEETAKKEREKSCSNIN